MNVNSLSSKNSMISPRFESLGKFKKLDANLSTSKKVIIIALLVLGVALITTGIAGLIAYKFSYLLASSIATVGILSLCSGIYLYKKKEYSKPVKIAPKKMIMIPQIDLPIDQKIPEKETLIEIVYTPIKPSTTPPKESPRAVTPPTPATPSTPTMLNGNEGFAILAKSTI